MNPRWRSVFLGVGLAGALGAQPAPGDVDWRRFDLNKDQRLDQADKALIFKGGVWAATLDINNDQRKDLDDACALLLLMTMWDRNADLAVTAEDFGPLPPMHLPKPDAMAARTLASACLRELATKVPADQEDRLRREWEPLKVLQAKDEAALFEASGALALTLRNLDVAQWAYAKACELGPQRDSAFANLAFTLAERARYPEAMVLLAYARELHPKSGVTSNTLAWIFARNGQLDQARLFYLEAVLALPEVAQYHLNLGVVLLRQGDHAGAAAEFELAAKLNPDDRDALYMALATRPRGRATISEVQEQYEKECEKHNKTASEDERMSPWKELDVDAQIDQVINQAAGRVHQEKYHALKELTHQTKQRLLQAVEPAAQKWKDAQEDFDRWKANGQGAYLALQQVVQDGNHRARELATVFKRKEGAAILEAGPLVLQLALAEAQRNMAGYGHGAQARQAFEKTVDELYTRRMAYARELMVHGRDTAYLDLRPEEQNATMAAVAGYLPIIAAAASDAAYGKDFLAKKDKLPKLEAKLKVPGADEPAFGLSLGIVGVEWNSESNEFKLQAGQGVIAAGTWSPTRGFGFQLGVGVSFTEGAFKVKAGNFIKFGSDGSINVDYKGGATVGAGPLSMGWTDSLTLPVRAATHEPIGTLE